MGGTESVSTCFIFFDTTYSVGNDLPDKLTAVCLDDEAGVDVALSDHSIDAICAMQKKSTKTVIVLPAEVASIHLMNLPKLGRRKEREAIAFALEDMVAEPIDSLHIAFDRDKENAVYRVVVLNKLRLLGWLDALDAQEITYDAITLDWCALSQNQIIATDTDLLVNLKTPKDMLGAALTPQLAEAYFNKVVRDTPVDALCFEDSLECLCDERFSCEKGSYKLWVAKHLLKHVFVDLCQGELQKTTKSTGSSFSSKLLIMLLGVWFVSIIGVNSYLVHDIRGRKAKVDAEIASVYRVFFPEAKQVISPRFRIEQLLKTQSTPDKAAFWTILNKLSRAFSAHPLEVEAIQYRDDKITVHVSTKNFSTLDAFEKKLKRDGLKVKQLEAGSRNRQVVSVLELTL